MSTTRMAMSHRELPRFLRLLNVNKQRLLRSKLFPYVKEPVRTGSSNLSAHCLSSLIQDWNFILYSVEEVWLIPEGLVSRCVDDQHAGDLQVIFVKLYKQMSELVINK